MSRSTHRTSFFSPRTRKGWLVLLALGALVLLAACGSSTSGSGTTPTPTSGSTPTPTTGGSTATATTTGSGNAVTITTDSSGSFAFSPATLTVTVGTTVTWTNMTQAPHTVTSDDGKTFDSGSSNPVSPSGGTFSFTFTKAGTFTYHCQIHPFMKAIIIVQ
jgi:plastocyanin